MTEEQFEKAKFVKNGIDKCEKALSVKIRGICYEYGCIDNGTLCNMTLGDEEKEIITLVLKTGDEFSVSEEQFKEWQRLYPDVDVLQELRKMKGWCDSNPKKRKSESGIKRFITGWLAREQSEKKETDTGLPDWYPDTKQQPNDPELEKEIEQMMKEIGG